jgi:hypothetical protein
MYAVGGGHLLRAGWRRPIKEGSWEMQCSQLFGLHYRMRGEYRGCPRPLESWLAEEVARLGR